MTPVLVQTPLNVGLMLALTTLIDGPMLVDSSDWWPMLVDPSEWWPRVSTDPSEWWLHVFVLTFADPSNDSFIVLGIIFVQTVKCRWVERVESRCPVGWQLPHLQSKRPTITIVCDDSIHQRILLQQISPFLWELTCHAFLLKLLVSNI